MKPWLLGNTTVRSPFRLRDGLLALSKSLLQGNLRGEEQDKAFRQLLGEHGIVALGNDETYSVGRKWRSALNKLGFLYPELPSSAEFSQSELGGLPDTITPNGRRLIEADTVPAMQECFLRALAAHYIPSPSEPKFACSVFSPLRHTLAVMLELERQSGESRLDFLEMAVVVQLTSSDDSLADIAAHVLRLREERLAAPNKKQFDRQQREAAAIQHGYVAETFNDYADTNLRYLKATGLVQSKGRGIALVPEKHVLAEKLVQDTVVSNSNLAYFITLCNGSALPTDSKDSALAVLDNLLLLLNKRGIPFDVAGFPLETPADIAVIRHRIEELLSERNEEEYADMQAAEWEKIAACMELLITRKNKKTLLDGSEIEVPKSEAPAYFEWTVWRAFLAINSLVNKPYEARRFKIDQDFLPVGTAPGNGPDLIFEFDDFIIAAEVTLTENSRQEAAEGEPVRRHVADLALRSGKPVYGLFIANRIDSNTAETFRIGVWFTRNDEKIQLNIIPVTLQQFKAFFEALCKSGHREISQIRELLDKSSGLRPAHEAPLWKQEIGKLVDQKVQQNLLIRKFSNYQERLSCLNNGSFFCEATPILINFIKNNMISTTIQIIGGGLAGCEAAWQAAQRGCSVELYEMKPSKFSPAHESELLGELVCSNSLRSNAPDSAVGLLKEEMRRLDSLIIRAAEATAVPAGSALAVDRQQFAAFISQVMATHPRISVLRQEVTTLPETASPVILATGPLTSEAMTASLVALTGATHLAFYDAIAPIVAADSLNREIIYRKSRWDDDTPGDYLNCPMNEEQYTQFIDLLATAQAVPLKAFEEPKYFEGCLPIEVMCSRGKETLRFGPMKPVGLAHPVTGKEAHAVVQLRAENREETAYNLVGFQTKLTYAEQKRVFRSIPGLEKAEFVRLGSMHRNTFICAPALLDNSLQMKKRPGLFLAGQLSGVEGYVESAAMGLLAGINAARLLAGQAMAVPPPGTALGALLHHLTTTEPAHFQPSNVNFGLFPPVPNKMRKRNRGEYRAELALRLLEEWKLSGRVRR